MKHSDKKQLSHPKSVNVYLHPHQTMLNIWSDIYIQDMHNTRTWSNHTIAWPYLYNICNHISDGSQSYRKQYLCSFVVKAIQNFSLKMIDAGIIKHNATPPPPPPTHTHTQHSTTQHGAYKSKNSDNLLQHKNGGWKLQIHSFPSTCACMHTNRYIHAHKQACVQYASTDTDRQVKRRGGGGYDWQLKQRI